MRYDTGRAEDVALNTIAYDHCIFSTQRVGGISRYFCEIAARLPQHTGWRSCIVVPLHYNDYLADSSAPRLGMHLPMRWGQRGRLHRAVNSLLGPAILKLADADLLHRTYYTAKPRPVRGRFVITVFDMIHELFPQYFPANDLTSKNKRLNVEAADHVICISHSTADDLVRLLNVPRSKITVTHLGLSDGFADAATGDLPAENGRPYFLYVGNRGGYKNFARLLEAYGSSPRLKRDFDLIAFGGASFTVAESARFEALELRPNAVRRRTGSDADLARAYAGAHALVFPSEYEGFGIPPLEAMSCGCPVVCSGASSIPEVVGAAGEYFDPTSIDEIRAALERLADDERRRRALIEAGYLQRQNFSWDRCTSETLAVYRSVLCV